MTVVVCGCLRCLFARGCGWVSGREGISPTLTTGIVIARKWAEETRSIPTSMHDMMETKDADESPATVRDVRGEVKISTRRLGMRFMMTLADTVGWCIGIILMSPCWYWRQQAQAQAQASRETRQQGSKATGQGSEIWIKIRINGLRPCIQMSCHDSVLASDAYEDTTSTQHPWSQLCWRIVGALPTHCWHIPYHWASPLGVEAVCLTLTTP